MTKDEALDLALEVLIQLRTPLRVNTSLDAYDVGRAITAIKQALAAPVQEPVGGVDQTIMELAESVGLIGPASRTHDLHAAIQRFHDLICVNATIKAANMAADAIRESTPPAAPVQEPVLCVSSADFKRMRSGDDHIKAWLPPATSMEDMCLYNTPPAAQPAPTVQEPVAWMYDFLNPDNRDEVIRNWTTQNFSDIEQEVGFNV